MSRFLKFIVNTFLVVAILTAAAILVPPLLGVNTTIVDTAAMDTNLPLGSVTYSVNVPVTKLQVGDEVLKENGTSTYAYIIEEGDVGTGKFKVASAVDRDSVTEITLRNTVSLVRLSIPYIGYVVVAMQTMEGIIIIVLVVLFIIILFVLSELWKVKDDDDDDTDADSFLPDDVPKTEEDEALNAELASESNFNEIDPGPQTDEEINIFDQPQTDAEPAGPSGIFGGEAPAPVVQELFGESAGESQQPEEIFRPEAEQFVEEGLPQERIQNADIYEEPSEEAAAVEIPAVETLSEVPAEPAVWGQMPEGILDAENDGETVLTDHVDKEEVQEEIVPGYEEERAEFLEPNQFVAVDRLTLEEILEQARKNGGEPEVNRDDISGVNIVDYSKLI